MTGPTEAEDTRGQAADRVIDAAGFDSFPASDPPGWWSGPEPAAAPPGDHEDQEHEEDRWS